mgnify:CR=1 FL=1
MFTVIIKISEKVGLDSAKTIEIFEGTKPKMTFGSPNLHDSFPKMVENVKKRVLKNWNFETVAKKFSKNYRI